MAATGDVGRLRRYADSPERLAIRVTDMPGRVYDEDRHVHRYAVEVGHRELTIRRHDRVVESECAVPLAGRNLAEATFERREKCVERGRLRITGNEHVRDNDFVDEVHVRLDKPG